MSIRAVLSLGSNLGDRAETLRSAIRDIGALHAVTVTAVSGLVETAAIKPQGIDPDAPPYLNAVAIVTTTLEPHELLAALHGIEFDHGRLRTEPWGDRTLDIDLVEFGGQTISEGGLTLPHPRAHERAFVLAPWLQVEPDAVLTGHGRIDALLTEEPPAPFPAEPLL